MKRIGITFLALILSSVVSTLLVGCGPTMKVGGKITWRGHEYLIDKPLPRGTPISCNLGSLNYDGTSYAVCTSPKRLFFHATYVVLKNGDSSWVAVALGEH